MEYVTEERRAMAKKYSCKTCGAELFFDPKTGKLQCEYCGSSFDPSEYNYSAGEDSAADETIAQAGNEGQGVDAAATDEHATDESVSLDDLVVYKCPNCGAEVITSKKTVATTCVYCNRAITLTGNVQGSFKPDYVLPFEKDRKDVEAAYRNLCGQSVLTPRLFRKDSTVEKIKGMYVPYWLYSFYGEATLYVHCENRSVHRRGDDEITETARYDVEEQGAGHFSRVPADAMKAMDNTMMDSIEPYDFQKLKVFNPAYLTGFYTQQWDEDAGTNEPRAKARAKEALSQETLQHVGMYQSRVIRREDYNWKGEKVELAMLPVWMMYTKYKGKDYVFGMNGQTGKMMGHIPQDPGRLLQIGTMVFVISQVIMLILRVVGVM